MATALNAKDVSVQSPHDVYLEVELNGQPTSIIVPFRDLNGHLAAAGKDLNEVGLNTERLGLDQAAVIQLDSIPGLSYAYDEARQIVQIQASDEIREPYRFNTRTPSKPARAVSSTGLFVNYDAFAQFGPSRQLAIANDEHFFSPFGVLSHSGMAELSGARRHYTRYMTTWTHSDESTGTTLQIGDAISSSLAWTRSIRIAGFQWGSNFELRPDLVTLPVPVLYGSAVVPSSVELFVNNVRQYSGTVPSGPFIIDATPGITGAGEATIVTHDALGRAVSTSVPLYVDPRMLAPGLWSYSFEAGFLRRAYGLESFSYDPHLALSGTARFGLTNTVTLEGHAEATHGLLNAGGGALMRLGQFGVVSGSLSASEGTFAGSRLSLGYQLIEPSYSITAQTLRAFGNFDDLASGQGAPAASVIDQATLSFPLVRHQTISLSYIGTKYPHAPVSKIGAISCTLDLGDLGSVNVSAYRDFKQRGASGAFLTLSFGFLHKSAVNASVGRDNRQSNYNIDATRAPDYEGGWGWGAQAGGTDVSRFGRAQAQYLGSAGELTAAAQRIDKATSGSLDVIGALVLMDESIHLSRYIEGGFALVSTDGVAGIPVLHENRLIGVTDRSGHLLVPNLNAYENNQVSIDPTRLPADVRLAATSMNLTPQARSGVLAHFGVTRYQAASVIVYGLDGKPLPLGTKVHDEENGTDTIVGYDGVAFVEGLARENRLAIGGGASRCLVKFTYAPTSDGSLPTIGPLTCRAETGGPR